MKDTWSKDFVEHLRTVHFALLTLCITLSVVAFSAKRYEHYHAQKQILRLLDGNFLKKPAIAIWEAKHPKTANFVQGELGKSAEGTPLSPEEVLSQNCNLPNKPKSCTAAYIRMIVVKIADSDFCLDIPAKTTMDIDNLSPDLSKSPPESYVLNTFEGVRDFWESLDRKGAQARTIGDLENFQASIDGAIVENISLRVSPSTLYNTCIPLEIHSLKAGQKWAELKNEPSVWKFLNKNDRVLLSGSVKVNGHEIQVTTESTGIHSVICAQ